MNFTKAVYSVAYEIFDVANSWLPHRVEKSLSKNMEKERLSLSSRGES
jgi:hypothetical protein